MAKLKVEDLKRIRESVKGTVNLRDGNFRVKITVHMGTCGIAAGARSLMTALLKEIETRGVQDVIAQHRPGIDHHARCRAEHIGASTVQSQRARVAGDQRLQPASPLNHLPACRRSPARQA